MTRLFRASEHSSLQRILESAVVLSWNDLMSSGEGCIQIEFRTSGPNLVEYLKLWACGAMRGNWSLVCESSGASPNTPRRMDFSNGFHSGFLSQTLEFVLANQERFPISSDSCTSLAQIQAPTEQEIASATECVRQARETQAIQSASGGD